MIIPLSMLVIMDSDSINSLEHVLLESLFWTAKIYVLT